METKNYKKKLVQKRKDNGLCILCGNPLDREGVHCKKCREKINEEVRKDREFYAKNGICPRCRKNKLFGNEKVCPECAAKGYENTMRTREGTHYNEVHRKWAKEEYERRKQNGICTRCGKQKADSGYYTCGICRDKDRNKKRIKSTAIPKNERINLGLCYFCDNPVKEGYKVCEKHYLMNLEKSRSEKAKLARDGMKRKYGF